MHSKCLSAKLLPLIILFIISACGQKEDSKTILVKEFPQEISIEGEQIDFDSIPLCPSDLMVKDSLLIKKRWGRVCDDYLFYVYNVNTWELLGAFGTEGRGPNEFLYPITNFQFENNESSVNLWVNDLHQNRIQLMNINESLEKNNPVFDNSIANIEKIPDMIDVIVLPDGNIAGRSLAPLGRMFYYDKMRDSVKWMEYFPKVEQWPPDHMLVNLYNGPTGIKPDNSRIVSALRYFKRIDVFSPETEHLFSIVFDDSPDNPEYYTNPDNPTPNTLAYYFTLMHLSDNYIYVFNKNISHDNVSLNETPELYVFTWEGEPVISYSLDRRFSSFSVDEDNGYLYALIPPDTEEITSQVFRYHIDEIRNR